LTFTGIPVFNSHSQRFSCPDQNSEAFSSCQGRVDEIPEEHFEMLGKHRNNYRFKFAPLRFMDRNGIIQVQLRNIITFV